MRLGDLFDRSVNELPPTFSLLADPHTWHWSRFFPGHSEREGPSGLPGARILKTWGMRGGSGSVLSEIIGV